MKKVLVVGGGIGGLVAALALRRRGIDVEVVEKTVEGTAVPGVGIILQSNGMRALKEVGLAEAVYDEGFGVDVKSFHDHTGDRRVAQAAARLAYADRPSICNIERPRLHEVLSRAVADAGIAVRQGTVVTDVEITAERTTATFDDGRSAGYDLVVGADGMHSTLRTRVFGAQYAARYTGYGAWRVTVPRDPQLDYQGTYQGLNVTKAGLIPLTEATMYLYLITSEPGNPRMPRERLHTLLRDRLAGYRGPIGAVRDALASPDGIVYVSLEQVELPPRWYRDTLVLIGDAAHGCLPHMAQGAGMAIEDAIVLAELAAEDLPMPERLERFMARRHARCMYVQNGSLAMADDDQKLTPEEIPAYCESLARKLPGFWTAFDNWAKQPL